MRSRFALVLVSALLVGKPVAAQDDGAQVQAREAVAVGDQRHDGRDDLGALDAVRQAHRPVSREGGWQLRLTTPVVVAGSATAALSLAAVVSGVVALSANGAFEDAVARSNDPSSSQAARERAAAEGLAAAQTANTTAVLTDIFLIGAIAAAGMTTFFVVVDGMDHGSQTASGAGRLGVAVAPIPAGGALLVHGRF